MVIEVSTSGIVYVLFRQRWVILGFLSFFVLAAVGYCLYATPRYQADAAVIANFNRQLTGDVSADKGGGGGGAAPAAADEAINSYSMVLQSDTLAAQVINEVGLDKMYPALYEAQVAPKTWNLSDFLGLHSKTPMERAVSRLTTSDIKLEVPKDSTVIQISLFNADPQIAKRALNVLVARFLEQQGKIGRDPQLSFVQNQAAIYKKQVADAQAAMETFQLKNHISSMDEETSYLLKQRSDLETQAATNNVRIEEDQRRITALTEQLKTLKQTVDLHQEDRDAALDAARAQLVELQVRQESLSTGFGPNSPAAVETRAQIAKVQSFINSYPNRTPLVQMAPNTTYQTTQSALLASSADLQAALKAQPLLQTQIESITTRLAERSREQSTYQDLVREYQIEDENYRAYLQAVQQARIADDLNKSQSTTVAVYDPPHMYSSAPTRPKTALILAGGLFLGLLLGFSGAFLRESLDERLNTPRQVNTLLGLPLLGTMADFDRPTVAEVGRG
jgi:succinoglycan biosynthesis transport protein ExoP